MMTETVLYLIRHAESAPSRDIAEPEWPLSSEGVSQAARLAAAFDGTEVHAVFSSPYRRAIDTITPLAIRKGLGVEIVPELRERKLAGAPVPDWQSAVKQSWEDPDLALPGGESNRACQRRVLDAVMRLSTGHAGRTLAISSHGNALGLLLNAIDPSFGYEHWRSMKNPNVFRVLHREGRLAWISNAPTLP